MKVNHFSFFSRLEDGGGVNEENFRLRACPLSTHDGRTGCNLTAHNYYKIHILINETRDNETYINIFSLDFQGRQQVDWPVLIKYQEFYGGNTMLKYVLLPHLVLVRVLREVAFCPFF